jgi:hypothetical protein
MRIAVGAIVQDADNVHLGRGMGKFHGQLGLLAEPLQEANILAESCIEDLYGYLLALWQILSQPHRGHATAAQLAEQLVAITQYSTDHSPSFNPDSGQD